jgi:acyl carrier protein phosphodiesterase
MNFLAHIFLSFDDDEIRIGNFIADSIRGNNFKHLPEQIQKGILLHREIDSFTDAHPLHKKSRKRLHKNHGHYSGVVVDVFYDHFLAKNWQGYSDEILEDYVERFYGLLKTNYPIMPDPVKKMMPYLIGDNWLLNYAHIEGINAVLNGLYRRTHKRSNMNVAVVDLKAHYDLFEAEFHAFFEELIIFSNLKYKSLL